MKPPSFDYVAPATVGEAVTLLDDFDGEAKVLAGGQSLMPLLNMRMARPGLLVDVARISELDFVREEGGDIAIGAIVARSGLERRIAMVPWMGSSVGWQRGHRCKPKGLVAEGWR